MPDKPVRVRIAPSPSGYLHVGTARTALFNWLFARQNGGKFIVRIEDTDAERSDADLIDPILDAIKWLGMEWDEEPIFQSQRLDRYSTYVDKLLESGHAYRCFRTPEEMQEKRNELSKTKKDTRLSREWLKCSIDEEKKNLENNTKFAVRIEIPDGETTYHDIILGDVTRQNSEIEDFVICRSDGRAVYNLAVVVDDHEMGISHVIRGNDHVTNTFKQILLYRALNLDIPEFAHVPLILRPDKRKVSKRLGDKDVAEYGHEGILPEALFNFLCLLGWSPKDDREFLPREELVDIFKLENVNKANPIFNEEKLLSLNQQYIMNMPNHQLADLVAPMIVSAGHTTKYWLETRWQYLLDIIEMLKERCKRLTDFVEKSDYFFIDEFEYDPKAEAKQFTPEGREYLIKLKTKFEGLTGFGHDEINSAISSLAEELDIKKGKLIHPTRLAVSGTPVGPGLYEMLSALGKDNVIKRIQKAIDYIDSKEA